MACSLLASPSKAFKPSRLSLTGPSIRHLNLKSTAVGAAAAQPTTALLSRKHRHYSTPPPHHSYNKALHCAKLLPLAGFHCTATAAERSRGFTSTALSAVSTDDASSARDAAIAAVQQAEDALNREAGNAGGAAGAEAGAAIAAARAAARSAMESLQRGRGGGGFGYGGGADEAQDVFVAKQVSLCSLCIIIT